LAAAPGFDFLRGGMGMTWTPDSRELWFLNGERMGFNVFAADAATGGVRHVTTGPLLKRRCLRRNLEWFNKWLKGDRATSFEKLFPAHEEPAKAVAPGSLRNLGS
jgi:hypothetical protein